MTLPIPPAVLYAGLAGVLLSLIVATALNGWQCRVFVILALRLAIGWLFLFEGLNKLNSFAVGPTDSNKVFTSAPYFNAAEGPLGSYMRAKYLGDPEKTYTERLTKTKPVTPYQFDQLSLAEQAALAPDWLPPLLEGSQDEAVAKATADKAKATADLEKAKTALGKLTDAAKAEADKAKAWVLGRQVDAAKAKVDTLKAQLKGYDGRLKKLAQDKADGFASQKAWFAGWLHGTQTYDSKVNLVSGDAPLTADERLAGIAMLQKESDALTARETEGLNGVHYEKDRRKKLQADLRKAKTDLAGDIDRIADGLRADAGLPPREASAEPKPIEQLDHLTAWTITLVGAGLLAGLFTKLWALVGFGFLVMTYLAHPTVPWLPLPPGTEGSPLFINKNLVMAFGLLVVLAHPTGRWLGLDALLGRVVFGSGRQSPPPPATA